MTLNDLARLRRIKARPAIPLVLTDYSEVHVFCADNDFPVIWLPAVGKDADLSPLYDLDLWVIATKAPMMDIRKHHPRSIWITGAFGYGGKIREAIGRNPLWN